MFNDTFNGPAPRETVERYVYDVPSDTNPRQSYRVDLVANGGGGRCSCADFAARRQPELDLGAEILTRATTCKHTRKAFDHFARQMMRALAQSEAEQ